jgi:C1A family cysteine protease
MMQKTLLVAAAVAAVASAADHPVRERLEAMFYDHLQKYDLEFESGKEFLHHLESFIDNVQFIEDHNSNEQKTFTMGLNQYSHLSHSEFLKYMQLSTSAPSLRRESPFVHGEPSNMVGVPDEVNWVTSGAVTPVKNQGQCGSCWSFSTTGSMEGAYYVKNGKLPSKTGFSEQNLVSCDKTDHACNGGWMDNAFKWIKSNGGIATEEDYPYTSGAGSVPACDSSVSTVSGSAPSSFTDVQAGSVSAMMSAVAQQPVSIAIQADQRSFQHYTSGVLTDGCGQQLDHGVLAAGYGTENGVDYWLVKNSWGPTWGDAGYIKIERSDANLCGVLSSASYPNM